MENLQDVLSKVLELNQQDRYALIEELTKSEEFKRRTKLVGAFSKIRLLINLSNFKSQFVPNIEYSHMFNKTIGKSPVSEKEYYELKSALNKLYKAIEQAYLSL